MIETLHADELPVDERLVEALLARDCPDLAGRPVGRLGSTGSSNALFRLGEDLLVRLPRQPGGTATIEKEARWGPVLAPLLPVPVPEVVAVGRPGFGYPERWSVVRWIDGTPPEPGTGGPQAGRDLAALLRGLRSAAVPEEAHADPALQWYRGLPLATRDEDTRWHAEQCRQHGVDLDVDRALEVWEATLGAPGVEGTDEVGWYHGDLFCENVLVAGGRLTGVLDLGGLGVGDPTVDLIVAWEVLDGAGRATFRDELAVDDATWRRGRGWALSLALGTLAYYWGLMPERCASKLAVVRAVLDDHDDPDGHGPLMDGG